MTLDARVTELESRVAFQDDSLQTLSDVLIRQQREIDRLQAQLTALLKRQEESQGQFQVAEQEMPPPHY